MNRIKHLIVFLFLSVLSVFSAHAQQTIEMADGMRAEGKIYVVVAVAAVVFTVILVYIIMLDRRIKGLEKKQSDRMSSAK